MEQPGATRLFTLRSKFALFRAFNIKTLVLAASKYLAPGDAARLDHQTGLYRLPLAYFVIQWKLP